MGFIWVEGLLGFRDLFAFWGGGGDVGLGLLCFGGLACKAFGVYVLRKIHNLGRASTESLYSFGEFSMRAVYGLYMAWHEVFVGPGPYTVKRRHNQYTEKSHTAPNCKLYCPQILSLTGPNS